jgi:hypothetical protein
LISYSSHATSSGLMASRAPLAAAARPMT